MTKDEIIEGVAKGYFETHKEAKAGLFTSDGMPFHDDQAGQAAASAHSRSNKFELFKISRLEVHGKHKAEADADQGDKKPEGKPTTKK